MKKDDFDDKPFKVFSRKKHVQDQSALNRFLRENHIVKIHYPTWGIIVEYKTTVEKLKEPSKIEELEIELKKLKESEKENLEKISNIEKGNKEYKINMNGLVKDKVRNIENNSKRKLNEKITETKREEREKYQKKLKDYNKDILKEFSKGRLTEDELLGQISIVGNEESKTIEIKSKNAVLVEYNKYGEKKDQ